MVYHVIGLMSGSSLDGLDIAYIELTEIAGKWSFEFIHTDCIAYNTELAQQLKAARTLPVPEFLNLHTFFGRFIATEINKFIERNELFHKVHFIASHGHTVWHDPSSKTSTQIGDGASIAALTGLAVISDLRNIDVALGGQGAPIVPIADQLLFADFEYCLNLGGIANMTINRSNPIAFDICPANQILNYFANKAGLDFDRDGALGRSGKVHNEKLSMADSHAYYQQAAPKSLDNSFAVNELLPLLDNLSPEDGLATTVHHIVTQIVSAIKPYVNEDTPQKMLLTGGGAHNTFLIEKIAAAVKSLNIEVTVPDTTIVDYKEALAMALMGALRWREEQNVLNTVTGAQRSSVGGALWLS
jgi:anhydro-N-acetylmuramic acid kinase